MVFSHGLIVEETTSIDWQPDGTIHYEWPDTPEQFRKNEKPGVYLWENGEIVFLRSFEDDEMESGNPDYFLNKSAKEEYYEKKE